MDAVLQDMEKKLGVKVNAFFAPDYAGIIQGMRFNKVDIAWYGNLSAMEAVDRANGQVFAQTVAADGSPGYWSVLIVNKDSPINNLNDLLAKRKDLTFGNGDPNSTSGFLVPGYYVFAKNNISASDFKRTVNAGHETITIAPPKRSWFSLLSWAVVLDVLVVSWQGAEMAPLTLIKDGGNMATFAVMTPTY